MSKILDWAKANMKDGANLAELEELVERENPLNGVKTKEEAEVFLKSNDLLKSAFDSSVSNAVRNHDEKFMNEKFPTLINEEREKIRLELNPKESDEQKEIRKLREEMQASKAEVARERLRGELRTKAKDYSLSEDVADSFVAFGDSALENLEKVGSYLNESIKAGVEAGIKNKFKGRQEPGGGKPTGDKVVSRGDWDNMGPSEQSTFINSGGIVVDE